MKNVAASVRQRLLNRARQEGRPFDELLNYYAIERFLYRLAHSSHAAHFVLKGAMLLRVWSADAFRPTRDIDLMGRTDNDPEAMDRIIRAVLSTVVEDDGLVFQPDSLLRESIAEEANYAGVRYRFFGCLEAARVNLQIDIGFGDVIYPGPTKTVLPPLLDFPAPTMHCYSRESVVAEKFEIMTKLGALNSRMKDFHDLSLMSRRFDFDAASLAEAIRRTFARRGTAVSADIEAFSQPFTEAKAVQWTAFEKRLGGRTPVAPFHETVAAIRTFLVPIASLITTGTPEINHWAAPGPWR